MSVIDINLPANSAKERPHEQTGDRPANDDRVAIVIGRGVGIVASHLELFEALDKCGAGTVDIGVIVYKRITLDRKGDVIAEKPMLQIVTSWDRLRQVLLKAIDRQRYHFGWCVRPR